jgi:preprotein translocase subunit SecB
MAKDDKEAKQEVNTPEGQQTSALPSVAVNAQYIKDLSYENPLNAIVLSQMKAQPKLDVSMDIKISNLDTERFEVALNVVAKAMAEEKTLYLVDLSYAAVVTIKNMNPQNLESALLVYVPSLLFPFARRILADTTREGLLPPLYLDPVDFAALYMQRKKAAPAA